MSANDLEKFHAAMLGIYEKAKGLKPPYHATAFLRMVNEHGGKEAADRLLAMPNPSSGFTELFFRGRENLKLSVEYVILQNPWRALFTQEQRAIARKRLVKVEVSPPEEDSPE